ncbi:MAG: universal stress protein [Gammaproteobacteria bacterium]|nr:universal stress protein [Gammaproteobacteria bacterium]
MLEQAQALDSQMIVMGAYGHSRIRELMLGGTTRYVLEHTSLPVLFSH